MDLTDVALEYRCAYCVAGEGAWCVRRSRTTGKVAGRASYLHAARTVPAREAWRLGWTDGVAQVIGDLRRWSTGAQGIDNATVAALEWAADKVESSWVARRD